MPCPRAVFPSSGQNSVVWNTTRCAKPPSTGSPQRPRRSRSRRRSRRGTRDAVLWRCCTRYNVALEQRKTWWERGHGIGATYYQQKAELPDLKAACPDYAAVNAQVLQEVILRVERA